MFLALSCLCARSAVATRHQLRAFFIPTASQRNLREGFGRSRRSLLALTDTSSDISYTILDPAPPTYGYDSHRDLEAMLRVAEEAALRAGEIMQRTSGKISVSETKANRRDLVTQSDIDCQRTIKEIISNAYPNDRFLGEEDVQAGSEASVLALEESLRSSGGSKFVWVVDPIDGTTNFQAGM